MTLLQEQLSRACRELGLDINLDHTVELASGCRITCAVHIPKLGGVKGMIIVASYDEIREVAQELLGQGYGYSVLSDSDPIYDREEYVEMFADWGWGDAQSDQE